MSSSSLSSSSSSPAYLPNPEVAAVEPSLALAFASFTEVAASLERTYAKLQMELGRLRHELEETNHDLAQSLQENQRIRQYLNRIVDGLPCGVLVTEADGLVSIANPESRRLLGLGVSVPLDHLKQVPVRSEDCSSARSPPPGEHECQCDAGAVQWIAIRCVPLETADGGSSIFILRDLSAAKRLEGEHECLRRRQALAEMSALLAHEIRNPLGSMELFAGLLAKSGLQTEERKWVEHLQAGLRTLAGTVNNVLHFHMQPPPDLAPHGSWRIAGLFGRFFAAHGTAGAGAHGIGARTGWRLWSRLTGIDWSRWYSIFGTQCFSLDARGGMLKISGASALLV